MKLATINVIPPSVPSSRKEFKPDTQLPKSNLEQNFQNTNTKNKFNILA